MADSDTADVYTDSAGRDISIGMGRTCCSGVERRPSRPRRCTRNGGVHNRARGHSHTPTDHCSTIGGDRHYVGASGTLANAALTFTRHSSPIVAEPLHLPPSLQHLRPCHWRRRPCFPHRARHRMGRARRLVADDRRARQRRRRLCVTVRRCRPHPRSRTVRFPSRAAEIRRRRAGVRRHRPCGR
jgi:hypothetical protein